MAIDSFKDAIDLYNKLLDADSIEDAGEILRTITEGVGFSAFAYMTTDGRERDGLPVHLTSLLPGFVSDYMAGEFWERDPAVRMATCTDSPYLWNDAYTASDSGTLPGTNWQEVDALARSHGYYDGLVLPMRTRETTFSVTLFSTERLLPRQIRTELLALGLVGLAFDSRLTPQAFPKGDCDKQGVDLTAREQDVLRWLSEGKTSEEIGKILSVSAKTINFHVGNLMHKLNAVNRTQAVAHAIRADII